MVVVKCFREHRGPNSSRGRHTRKMQRRLRELKREREAERQRVRRRRIIWAVCGVVLAAAAIAAAWRWAQ